MGRGWSLYLEGYTEGDQLEGRGVVGTGQSKRVQLAETETIVLETRSGFRSWLLSMASYLG